jgi:hypothetical protein
MLRFLLVIYPVLNINCSYKKKSIVIIYQKGKIALSHEFTVYNLKINIHNEIKAQE